MFWKVLLGYLFVFFIGGFLTFEAKELTGSEDVVSIVGWIIVITVAAYFPVLYFKESSKRHNSRPPQ